MTTVTLSLPDPVYEQIERAAATARRSVDDVLREAVSAVASLTSLAPGRERSAFAQMAYMNDAALWQAARAMMTAELRARMESLHERKREQGLDEADAAEEEALLALYRETLLVRAHAAVLLKQRGYDISDPTQFEPPA